MSIDLYQKKMKPTETLKTELELYLGEIMQELENTFDYFERKRLERHKKAIEILLMLSIES